MNPAASIPSMADQDRQIAYIFAQQAARLRSFIHRRVPNDADVEDLLQDVFYKLVEANRLLMPIDYVTGWLYRVARNRITDLFRKRRPEDFAAGAMEDEEGHLLTLEEWLPSSEAGPEDLYLRRLLLEELERALAELPADQRAIFVAHEFEGRSFQEMSDETGVSVNTLLSRKRYAVLHLRQRLRSLRDEFLGNE